MPNVNDCLAMTDHFEGMDKLVKEAPHTEGAPNFRRVRYCAVRLIYNLSQENFIR